MSAQRTLLGLVLGLTVALAAVAQSSSVLRWSGAGNGYFGLSAGHSDFKVPCGTVAFPCGVSVSLLEKEAWGTDWRFYGRLGPGVARSPATVLGAAGVDAGVGLSYGLGVSWELSPRTSATVSWDSHDYRFTGGEREQVRATSLGLQWRY